MAAFEYRQAQEIRDALARHGCRYLFIGQSGAILLGFPDTTQDAHLFVDRSPENGPFDLDLVFAPDDIIASKAATWRRKDLESLPRLRSFREYWLRQK